jgi:hypothetical protein
MGLLTVFLMAMPAVLMLSGSSRAAGVSTTPVHRYDPSITHLAALPKRAEDLTDDPGFIGYEIVTVSGQPFGKTDVQDLPQVLCVRGRKSVSGYASAMQPFWIYCG